MARGQKTGGRQKGTPNIATGQVRSAFQALLEANQTKLQAALDDAYESDKPAFFRMMMDLSEYVVPKLARTETTLSGDAERPPALVIKRSG